MKALALGLACTLVGVIVWLATAQVPTFEAVRAGYVPSEAWLLDRHGDVVDSRRITMDFRRLPWTPLDQVSPSFVSALLSGEDRSFETHSGVAWRSVAGAMRDLVVHQRRRGASTITMQVARLLSPAVRRSGLRAVPTKLNQMRMALALERAWSKREILEAYVNLLGYRGDAQGIAAAAARFVGKRPEAMTAAESVALAALLPDPGASVRSWTRRACARGDALRPAVPCAEVSGAVSHIAASRAAPAGEHLAPQLAQRLLSAPGERVRSTLDLRVQRLAVDVVSRRLSALADHNVRDGAALVVDNASGEVLAYVGSAGTRSRSLAVDGVLAPRQAGSTLKPFLYGLALERGYLTPASLLQDEPLSLETASGVYLPQDYEHDFKGTVSVRTALAGSLNIPAVRTLVLVGIEPFRDRLRALGYSGIRRDANFYGYSLALGSAEVSLWEQAMAYRALARGGLTGPLTLLPQADAGGQSQVIDRRASFVVSDILADATARAITFGLDSELKTPFWSAVKTGTSEDMRDNWCVGFTSRYTVAVWVGNFEGDSMRAVSGVSGAAPIWRELVMALEQGHRSAPPAPPAGVQARVVRFDPAVESARREWFFDGEPAAAGTVALVPNHVRPAIASPANGMIIAVDPDIPAQAQRVVFRTDGATADMRLLLNDEELGGAGKPYLWEPKPGVYRLTLRSANGAALDRVLFTVRGSGG